MARILRIQDDPNFADYAVQYCELQKPPKPDYRPTSTDRYFWRGLAILGLCSVGAFLYVAFFEWVQ